MKLSQKKEEAFSISNLRKHPRYPAATSLLSIVRLNYSRNSFLLNRGLAIRLSGIFWRAGKNAIITTELAHQIS